MNRYWELQYKCMAIAERAYNGKTDAKERGYYDHAKRVMDAVIKCISPNPDCQTDEDFMFSKLCGCAAVLHDVINCGNMTIDALRGEGIPQCLVDAVDSLTIKPGESFKEFIERSSKNTLGMFVEYFDILDMLDLTNLGHISAEDVNIINTYLDCEKILKDQLATANWYGWIENIEI